MRFRKKNHILLKFAVTGLVILCWSATGKAAAGTPSQEEQNESYAAVSYETQGDIYLGYRWTSTEDSLKAAEYIYPDSSLVLGVDLLSVPLPFRYHINGELFSREDFYLDGGFAYKDFILFRDILTGVHHNLIHYDYTMLDALYEEAGLDYIEKNPGADYYTDYTSNLLSLRLKMPDFPFHTFVNHRHVEREGIIQQRYLLGSFDDLMKVSESRLIDWKSDAVKLGANSHLGPFELEYAYDQTDFDHGPDDILFDGIYPHNVIPETESSAHAIKMHTSYTGAIVAAATLSNLSEKNTYSGTKSSTKKGAFDLSWIPDPVIGIFFRYRHTDTDTDTPGTLAGYPDPIPSVRPGLSFDRDVFILSSRYKPISILTLNANYEFSHLERRDVSVWRILPETSSLHSFALKADARPSDKLKVTAKYEFKDYNDPSYNNTPDKSNLLKLTTTYTPNPAYNLYLEYVISVTKRETLRYFIEAKDDVMATGKREGHHNRFLASLTGQLTPKATLTCSWFYQHWEIKQDLAYGRWSETDIGSGDWPYIDYLVPYADNSNTFSVALHLVPRQDLSIVADLSYAIADGKTGFHDVVGGAPFSLASYSVLDVTETSFSLDITKKILHDWEVGILSYVGVFNDKTSDFLDGEVFTTTFHLKRYF